MMNIQLDWLDLILSPVYPGHFCHALSRNFKITHANHQRFCRGDIAEVSNMFDTLCNSECDKNCIKLQDKNRLCNRCLSDQHSVPLLHLLLNQFYTEPSTVLF